MTNEIHRHPRKMLFPHLTRDQRNELLFTILLFLIAGLSAAGSLAMWVTSGRP